MGQSYVLTPNLCVLCYSVGSLLLICTQRSFLAAGHMPLLWLYHMSPDQALPESFWNHVIVD